MAITVKLFIVTSVLLVLCSSLASGIESKDTHFYFGSLPGHVEINEDPHRAEWQKPEKVIDYLLIKKGDTLADIGAGTGYFTVLLSKQVGENGKVYAVDVEKRMLDLIRSRAEKEGLNNITEILSKADNPLLPQASTDLIFICNTFFNFKDKVSYLTILKNALKKKGRLAIIEHRLNSKHDKPPLHKRTAKEKVLEAAAEAGFKLEADLFFLPYQYFLIFSKE